MDRSHVYSHSQFSLGHAHSQTKKLKSQQDKILLQNESKLIFLNKHITSNARKFAMGLQFL